MDITPHPNLLKSLRGERFDYVLLIGEGTDNAFDAAARLVEVTFDDEEIVFRDDGCGISKDRIRSIFSLGSHGGMTTTQLGRFGIGIKHQAVNAGDVFSVVSVSRDGKVKMRVNWRDVLKAGTWQIDDPRWEPIAIDAQTGTTIRISELRKARRKQPQEIIAELAKVFYPAIADGKRITINKQPVPFLREPRMTDIVERQLTLGSGRAAHIRAGLLAEGSHLYGIQVSFRHRVIMSNSAFACDPYSGLRKMFGRLQLDGAWHFAKFKNDLTDEGERDELEEAIKPVLRPLLEKCSAQSIDARLQELSRLLNERLPQDIAGARPKHQKPQEARDKERPRNSRPGAVEEEKSTPKGPAKTRKNKDRLLITFDGNAEEDGIGAFVAGGKTHRVNLSKDDPTIAQLIAHRDEATASQSLLAIAIALFEQGRQEHRPDPELPLEPFGLRIAKILSIQPTDKAEQAEQ